MDLSRNETRAIIHALCGEQQKIREELSLEDTLQDHEYQKLKGLIGKLIDHINKLPY